MIHYKKWLPSVLSTDLMFSLTQLCFVTGAPFSTNHCDLYKRIGWSSLHIGRLHHRLLIHKALLGKMPQYLSSLLHCFHNNNHLKSNDLTALSYSMVWTIFGHTPFLLQELMTGTLSKTQSYSSTIKYLPSSPHSLLCQVPVSCHSHAKCQSTVLVMPSASPQHLPCQGPIPRHLPCQVPIPSPCHTTY